jgi:DNA-binding NarL/FixJ family response regulator
MVASVRVMVVDDQPSFLRSAALALSSDPSVEVVTAVLSARDAMRELDDGLAIDLALIDLSMPDIGGLETIAWMQRSHPSVVPVLMSTYEPDELPVSARHARVTYLRKADLTADRVIALAEQNTARPQPPE